jgi:hypothetical protein
MPPTPPVMQDACGNTITPVLVWHPSPLTCEGDMVYTLYVYRLCCNTHVWTYTYTIDIPDFTLPADGASTVNCAATATPPTPPVMQDACGNYHSPVPGVTLPTDVAKAIWSIHFTYTDCCWQLACLDLLLIRSIFLISRCLLMGRQRSTVRRMQRLQHHRDAGCVWLTPSPQLPVCTLSLDLLKAIWFYTFTYTIALPTPMYGPIPYTIDIPDFTLPADGGVNVNCARDAYTSNTTE